MPKITKDTIIGTILDTAPEAAPLFLSIGMHCLGCPSSRGETVEQACMVHGVDCDEFLKTLDSYLNGGVYQVTKDTIIGDILDNAPEAAPMFLSIGMHCLGCPSSRGETVEEACMVHGIDCNEFLTALNAYLAAGKQN